MSDITFRPRIRVTLLENSGAIISDRLVDAYTEFNAGPKDKHNGPVRLEVTLTTSQDIDSLKNYIDQLKGNLPLKEAGTRGRPNTTPKEIESPREDILQKVEEMAKEGNNQDAIIKYLRDLGFVFITTEDFLFHFPDFELKVKDTGEPTSNKQYPKSLAWMARCIKRAKDPKTDKFDPMIIFGFNISDEPSKKIVPYLYKERRKPFKAELGKKKLNANSVEFTKLPPYLNPEERFKFSTEQRQLLLNPEKVPSKFFRRWASEVKVPTAVYEKLKERVPNLGHL